MEQWSDNFAVPEYYLKFRCKGDRCRHTCCGGLSVTISREEYFRLLSVEGSGNLRSDLDVSLDVLRDATPDRYAAIRPDYFGRCRMLDEQGWCRLQSECGFSALAAVCRYFPRSPGHRERPSCRMTNACEETLELLLAGESTLPVSTPLSFELAALPEPWPDPEEAAKREALRNACRTLMRLPLPFAERLGRIHTLLHSPKAAERSGTGAESGAFPEEDGIRRSVRDLLQTVTGARPELIAGVRRIIDWAGGEYASLRPYAVTASLLLAPPAQEAGTGSADGRIDAGRLKRGLLEILTRFPDYPGFLTRVLVNEMDWQDFPFLPRNCPAKSADRYLEILLILLILMTVSNVDVLSSEDDLVDLFAAVFRMADLTNFPANALALCRDY